MNAIRKLNGARIRGRRLKVSFAKYDKNNKNRNGSGLEGIGRETESEGGVHEHKANSRDRRSYKEVVEGGKHSKVDGWRMKNIRTVVDSSTEEYKMQIEKSQPQKDDMEVG